MTSLPPIDTTSRPSGFWTDERVEELRRLCETTLLSAKDIAFNLGIPEGKNMVIGKCRRLGIELPANRQRVAANGATTAPDQGGGEPKARAPRAARSSKPRPPQSPPVPPKEPPAVTQAVQPIEAVEALFESPRGVGPAVAALTLFSCRWPLGGDVLSDDFHFCMHPSDVTAPYCAHHSKIACPVGAPPRKGVGWGARAA